MNQRIDQLWAQALDAAVPETYTRLSHSQVLKIKQVFAKLIVQECIEQVITGPNGPAHYAVEAALRLKKHFGVEE